MKKFKERKDDLVNDILRIKNLIYDNYDILNEEKLESIEDACFLKLFTGELLGLVGYGMTGDEIPATIFIIAVLISTTKTFISEHLKESKKIKNSCTFQQDVYQDPNYSVSEKSMNKILKK